MIFAHTRSSRRLAFVALILAVVGVAVFFWKSTTPSVLRAGGEIDRVRASRGLSPSTLDMVSHADGRVSLETADGIVLIRDTANTHVGSENVVLWPKKGGVLYVIGNDWPWGGQIWKVDLATGAETELPSFNRAKGGFTYSIGPSEDVLVQPSWTPLEPSNPDGIVEAYAFDVMDLATGTVTKAGQLPAGYSYAYANGVVNQMGSGLYPMARFTWTDATRLRAEVYAASAKLGLDTERSAVGDVAFSLGDKKVSKVTKR